VIVQFDAALYFPVDIQIFTAGELALYYDGFADMRHICTTLLAGSIRVHGTDLLTSLADPGRRSKIRAFALRTQDSMSQYAKYEAALISKPTSYRCSTVCRKLYRADTPNATDGLHLGEKTDAA
jgi:hypothetical protein